MFDCGESCVKFILFGLGIGKTVVTFDKGGVDFDAFFGIGGGGFPVFLSGVACTADCGLVRSYCCVELSVVNANDIKESRRFVQVRMIPSIVKQSSNNVNSPPIGIVDTILGVNRNGSSVMLDGLIVLFVGECLVAKSSVRVRRIAGMMS